MEISKIKIGDGMYDIVDTKPYVQKKTINEVSSFTQGSLPEGKNISLPSIAYDDHILVINLNSVNTLEDTGELPSINMDSITVVDELIAEKVYIASQPKDFIGNIGDTAIFTVECIGQGLTYQWEFKTKSSSKWGDSGIGGSKTKTGSIAISQTRLNYEYRCRITDSNNNVIYSDPACMILAEQNTESD